MVSATECTMNNLHVMPNRMLRHPLGRNASWIILGQGVSFLFQASYFVLLARLLGVTQYGIFAGVFALASTLGPYCGAGAGMLFMRYGSADPRSAGSYWGYTLLVVPMVSLILAVGLYFAGPALSGVKDAVLISLVVVTVCLFGQVVIAAARVFQSYENLRATAAVTVLGNLLRFIAVTSMIIAFRHATAGEWAVGAVVASFVAAIIACISVHRTVGRPKFSVALVRRRAWEGFGFAFAGSAQFVYNDLDKTMLTHYGMAAAAGFYSLAYRIVDFATTPIGAIDAAVLPRYFVLARSGCGEVIQLASKTIKAVVVLGLVLAALLLITVPVVPYLAGRDFSAALNVVRWICCIPLFRGVHSITGSAITGLGMQPYRTATQCGTAVMNVVLNCWLIPVYGWRGAAWSSIASDGVLAILNAAVLVWISCRKRRPLTFAKPIE